MCPLQKLVQAQEAKADVTPGTQVGPVQAHSVDHVVGKVTAVSA